ncbi:hypothetical protein Ddye_007774 [Dipteronia dyeriana]|uniref:Uncharacterized protein n=1 Tax=Dipteronia dyeriana TaxID=168575 RepID=A0AAE0CRZ8_9ROSI|nr:hypothetical protein Ddye_007774 [Dipteronia dyeriana]
MEKPRIFSTPSTQQTQIHQHLPQTMFKKREVTIDGSVEIAMEQLEDWTPYSTLSHVKKKRNGITLTVKSTTARH